MAGGQPFNGTLPPTAFTGHPGDGYTMGGAGPAACGMAVASGPPLPETVFDNWSPPGIARPWPQDEYIHDGGDQGVHVSIAADYSVKGLDPQDTVAHYDCLDGRTIITPTNRVDIYAPRFAAVRKVENLISNDQVDRAGGVELPVRLIDHDEVQLANTTLQPVQPEAEIVNRRLTILEKQQQPGAADNRIKPAAFQVGLLPYENFSIIRTGVYEQDDKAVLAKSVQNAVAWTDDAAVQVVIDRKHAVVETGEQKAQAIFTVDLPSCPRLRICKVASTQNALPGEIIEFTIRFDNVGEAPMGNVTILDNLTTRLEYVPGTGQSSRAAEFSTKRSESESLVLQWDLTDPLPAGQGGVVRFNCKVR